MRQVRRFLNTRSGATAIEYGLIVALLSLVVVGAVGSTGNSIQSMFSDQDRALQQAFK